MSVSLALLTFLDSLKTVMEKGGPEIIGTEDFLSDGHP